MRFPTALFLVCLIFGVANAQNDFPEPEDLVGLSHAERTQAYDRFYHYTMCGMDSLSVTELVSKLRHAAVELADNELDLEADLIWTHYFFCNRSLPAQMIHDELTALRDKAAGTSLWLHIRAESMLGHFNMHRLEAYEQGLIHLTRAANLMDDQTSKDYPLKQVCNYHVGIQLYRFGDYENALDYLNRASEAGIQERVKDIRHEINNTIGLLYRKLNDLDNSDKHFQLAFDQSKAINDSAWMGICAGNLGENFFLRGDYDQAYPLLVTDAHSAIRINDKGLASNSLSLLGDIQLQWGNTETADSLLQLASQYAHESGHYSRLEVLYPRLAKLAAAKGSVKEAQAYIDSSLMVTDSLERATNSLRAARASQKVEIEQLQKQAEELDLLRSYQINRRNSIILILFLLMIIAGLLFNRHRLKTRERQLLLEQAKQNAEEELQKAIDRLNELAANNKRDLEQKEHLKESEKLENKVILTDKDWREFSGLFEQVHPGFMTRLTEKLPGITAAETRFMVLSRLNLSVKEKAAILGVSQEAIRQMRYRIRKKWNLESDTDLLVFSESI